MPSPAWFRKAIQTPYEDRTVNVGDCPIHYLRWGESGRPGGLVFVHGGAAHAHWWSFIAPQFAAEYAAAALDLSGHGDSGWRPDYPTDLWHKEVMAVAEHAEFDGPPVVIGHSLGGFVALATAAAYGDALAGVAVLDSPVRQPDPEDQEGAHGHAFQNPKVYADIETALKHFRTVPDQPSSQPYILDYIARQSLRPVEDGWTWKFDPHVFVRHKTRARPEILRKIVCRVALFRSENGLVTPDIGEYMYQQLGHVAPIIEVPEAYHHVMLDQPLPLVTGLRALLADWQHSVPHARRG